MLLLAAPAMAATTVTCVAEANGVVRIEYDATGETEVRAFGLDVEVDASAQITAVISVNADYYIYPGTIEITDGNVTGWGSPVAPANDPGAKGGLETGAVTLELGSLYADGDPAPALSGVLCTLQVKGAMDCNVTVTANITRGGVVNVNAETVATGSSTCLATGIPTLESECWGYDCFDCGDGNGDCFVTFTDLSIIINAWNPLPYDACADYNKDGFVTFSDISVLINHWSPLEACPSAEGCSPCTPI